MGIFNRGVLGINARNLLYIRSYNKEKSVEIADDKLKTKAFLSARDIPVPKLLGTIANREELKRFNFSKLGSEFVIKPNLGYGGGGIIPIISRSEEYFFDVNNEKITKEHLHEHILKILNGNFSITDRPDKAFFEKLIVTDDFISPFCEEGLPDIRVIVYNLVPVMAMLRIPSKESSGRANLHQGAYGAGIDLAKGEVTHLLHHGKIIKEIPDRGVVRGLKIPFWDEILKIACKSQLATNLGYMGADLTIDRHQGPLLIEINARAGIDIQLANLAPLRRRLEILEGLEIKSIEKGIRMGKDMFGYSLEKNIRSISGKKVVGLYENVEIINKKIKLQSIAFLNTARKKSYIGPELAKNLKLITSKRTKNHEELKFKLKFKLGGKTITSIFKLDKNLKKKYQVMIGSRDLMGQFLIDTSIKNLLSEKKQGTTKKIFISNYDPLETDKQICKIINQFKFCSYLRPLNFHKESEKFLEEKSYNPQFIYKDNEYEIIELQKDIEKIRYDDSEIGKLFHKKIEELNEISKLVRMRGSSEFASFSAKIFGSPTLKDIEEIDSSKSLPNVRRSKQKINSDQLQRIFENYLHRYGLNEWRVIQKKDLLTKCVVNKNKKILIKSDSLFSEDRVNELIIHEICTHLLTSENGSKQPYRLFRYGFANYLETQEGLAMHNVFTQSDIYNETRHKNLLTKAIYWAETLSMSELFHKLKQEKLTDQSALNICLRVKRGLSDTSKGGAFCKDFCYFKGRKKIINFLANNGNLADLYIGKFSVDDLSTIKNIYSPSASIILPYWLDNKHTIAE